MRRDRIRSITFIALCASIMAVLSQLAIPLGPVPLTVQAFTVSLIGFYLGGKCGLASVAVYIALGAVGAPVFAGLQGGFGVLIGYTGGFVWGYMPFVCMCGLGRRPAVKITCGICGLVLCHLIGTIQYAILAELSVGKALLIVSAPYILKDVFLVVGAFFVAKTLKKRLKI